MKLTLKYKVLTVCAFLALTILSSCNFLEVVPDNTITLEDRFMTRQSAFNGLSNIYAGLPNDHLFHQTRYLLGDEWLGRRSETRNLTELWGTRIMEGHQNANDPMLNFWHGWGGGTPLYERIRLANTFLEYIHLTGDLGPRERREWIAQAEFLKAYFHFILIQHYGPIVIVDENLPLNAESSELFQSRSKIDESFNYVIDLMKHAINDLSDDPHLSSNLGMVTKAAGKAILARVMLFRASPLFNGPIDLYSNFFDHDGEPFFPMDAEGSPAWRQKWLDAEMAVIDAIRECEDAGFELYQFQGAPYSFDAEAWANNKDVMETFYTLRMLNVDPWNKELVWGRTYPLSMASTDNGLIQSASNFRLPPEFILGGVEQSANTWNAASATYQAMNRYYTKNGLPVDADKTFDRTNMFRLVLTPDEDEDEYQELQGIMQPGVQTIKMYLEREPRFYANLGITGGYWRSHQFIVPVHMYGGTAGGFSGRWQDDFYWTGIGVKKFVHPETKSEHTVRQMHFPYPIIRMADLYLMKAEILNELYGPGPDVYVEINKIRKRAGIPDVEKVWADADLVNVLDLNRHLTKDGMRDIILHERAIEFAFEGLRYWDVVRYKRGPTEFNTPVTGWNGEGFTPVTFFRLEVKQRRQFLTRNYFWPLSIEELDINGNLIQNFGW